MLPSCMLFCCFAESPSQESCTGSQSPLKLFQLFIKAMGKKEPSVAVWWWFFLCSSSLVETVAEQVSVQVGNMQHIVVESWGGGITNKMRIRIYIVMIRYIINVIRITI